MQKSKIEQLEQQLKLAKQEAYQEQVKEKTANYIKKYKGKAFLVVQKWDKRTKYLTITRYNDFVLNERHEPKILAEELKFTYIKNPRKNDWQVSLLQHTFPTNPKIPGYNYSIPTMHREISIAEFNNYANYIKVCSENIIDSLEGINELDWVERVGEHSERKALEESANTLDIPHIVLTSDEAFLIGKCAYLNHNIFLLTKGSMLYLNEQLKKNCSWDAFATSACESAGEQWRGGKVDRFTQLKAKLRAAFEEYNIT